MKIKQEHYKHIEDSIKHTIWLNGISPILKLKEKHKTDKDVKDYRVRLMYDLLRLNVKSRWIVDNLYPYCNDAHITTCLLKIGKDLGLLD